MFHQIHLQSAADATVLKGYEVIGPVIAYYAPFLNERGIDVHLAYVVDNYGKANAAFVGKYTVEESCFPLPRYPVSRSTGIVLFFILLLL